MRAGDPVEADAWICSGLRDFQVSAGLSDRESDDLSPWHRGTLSVAWIVVDLVYRKTLNTSPLHEPSALRNRLPDGI
jgi:hypothetical protein